MAITMSDSPTMRRGRLRPGAKGDGNRVSRGTNRDSDRRFGHSRCATIDGDHCITDGGMRRIFNHQKDRYRSIPEVDDEVDRVFRDGNFLALVRKYALSDLKEVGTGSETI